MTLLSSNEPTLVLIDGVTEAMSLHRLKSVDNDDLATFGRLITRPIAATGAATVDLDHQPKAIDNRGRYALGGVHSSTDCPGRRPSPRTSPRWASDCAASPGYGSPKTGPASYERTDCHPLG